MSDLSVRLARLEAQYAELSQALALRTASVGRQKTWISATAADDLVGWRHGETKRRAEAGALISRTKSGRGPKGKVLFVRRADVLAEAEKNP